MSYQERDGQVIFTMKEKFRRAEVSEEIMCLFEQWCKDTEKKQGSPVTCGQRIGYFREAFIDAVWRKWPQ